MIAKPLRERTRFVGLGICAQVSYAPAQPTFSIGGVVQCIRSANQTKFVNSGPCFDDRVMRIDL